MKSLYTATILISTTSKLPICRQSPLLSLRSSPFLRYSADHSLKHTGESRIPVRIEASSMASTPSTASSDRSQTTKPFSVLFVCLGNICRSPAAEGVFRHLVKQKNLDSMFYIDSAGTINYHEGNPADSRMRAASKRRGIEITSISRRIRPSDFRDFDLILAMDRQNREDILEAFERWRHRESFPIDADKKVELMCSYCKRHDETEVPDPYYGGPQGFEKLLADSTETSPDILPIPQWLSGNIGSKKLTYRVLDLLEDACESLLDKIVAEGSKV